MGKLNPKISITIILILLVIGGAIYANSFKNEFLFDDLTHVVRNTAIRSFGNIPSVFQHELTYFSGEEGGKFYRPFESITFMVDYFLWGLEPVGYHITNTLLHVAVCILLFFLMNSILKDAVLSSFISILYLVHPVHTEAVTYISGRADSISTFLLLLMIILQCKYWISDKRQEKILYYSSIIILFIAALFTKESALIFPVLLMFFEYCFRKENSYTSLFNKRTYFYIPFFIVMGAWFLFKNSIVSTEAMVEDVLPFNMRLVLLPKQIFNYVRLSLFPTDLHMEYRFPFTDTIFKSGYFEPFIFTAIFLVIIFYLWKKGENDKNFRIMFFGLGWFLIALFPYLSIVFPLNAVFSEHWLYIPLIGFLLSLAYFFYNQLGKNKLVRRYIVLLFAAVIGLYSYLTIKQNMVWKDAFTFYSYTLNYAPYSGKVYNGLALEYIERGDLAKAKELLEKAVKVEPRYKTAIDNLKTLRKQMGEK